MHVQVLRPVSAASKVKVMVTSGNLKLPFGGRARPVTTYRLQRDAGAHLRQARATTSRSARPAASAPSIRTARSSRCSATCRARRSAGITGAGKDMDGDVFTRQGAREPRAAHADDHRHRARRAALLPMKWAVALIAFLVLVAPARGELIVQGSDLAAPANTFNSHPRDWAAWPLAYESQPGVAATVQKQGEVAVARLKGMILPSTSGQALPPVVMHVVVMRPQPDGSAKLIVSTEDLPLPTTGDPQQINEHNLQALNARICVIPGDYVALATSGGYGAPGLPGRRPVPDVLAAAELFTPALRAGGGRRHLPGRRLEAGVMQRGSELLMQVVIGTREHARYTCRTPAEQAEGLPNPGEGTPPPGKPTPARNAVRHRCRGADQGLEGAPEQGDDHAALRRSGRLCREARAVEPRHHLRHGALPARRGRDGDRQGEDEQGREAEDEAGARQVQRAGADAVRDQGRQDGQHRLQVQEGLTRRAPSGSWAPLTSFSFAGFCRRLMRPSRLRAVRWSSVSQAAAIATGSRLRV